MKKIKDLCIQKEDAEKTLLKKRANKNFNNYLKAIDNELYSHL
jgi:hypothetical protein